MTTGAIAYEELAKTTPAVIAKVQAIMDAHPTPSLLIDRANTEKSDDAKAERLFMEIATWPDDVRPPSTYSKEFHHDTWHWINIVYTPEGSKYNKPQEVIKDRIFEAFNKNVFVISNASSTDADKAVALCWIFHLVGDSHQPLHTTALFDEEFPEGDKGGNSTKIRVKEGARIINLHQFWDGAVLGSSDPNAAKNMATKLRATYPKTSMTMLRERPYLNTSTFENWGRQEASALAVFISYDGGELLHYPKDDGAYQLTPEYIAYTKAIAEQQAVLAGYRIAEILTKLFGDQIAGTAKQ